MYNNNECGLVDPTLYNPNLDIEVGGCLGPNQKGFDVKDCMGCEFYPKSLIGG